MTKAQFKRKIIERAKKLCLEQQGHSLAHFDPPDQAPWVLRALMDVLGEKFEECE